MAPTRLVNLGRSIFDQAVINFRRIEAEPILSCFRQIINSLGRFKVMFTLFAGHCTFAMGLTIAGQCE